LRRNLFVAAALHQQLQNLVITASDFYVFEIHH
jgi:hypothetical protein